MLAEQRRSQILGILGEKGAVTVNELYRRLQVSRETIRRDITKLASERKLRKTHGGALAMDQVEPAFADRMETNIEGKKAIGQQAALLVPDGASLIINSGTTTLCLAEALIERHKLTIYTNDIQIAARLAGRNENRLILLGGEVQGTEGATLGRDTTDCLSKYFADFAFIGASALNADPVLSDFFREQAEFHSQMIEHARTTVLLVDHTKLNKRAPVRVENFEKVAHIFTDRKMSKEFEDALGGLNVEIFSADSKS
jgi:DeoR family transcriptional regulator, glycerol-3-phosphate regulon repressor